MSADNWQCNLLITPTDLDILVVTFFTWSFYIKCNANEFDSWDFCKNWISNSNDNCIFLIEYYHIKSFIDVERKSVFSVINTYQLPIHSGMDIVNVTVGCKNCCISSKMNNCIWCHWYTKEKVLDPTLSLV